VRVSVHYKQIQISFKTRFWIGVFRWLLKPWLARLITASHHKISKVQVFLGSRPIRYTAGLSWEYRIINRVPGPVIGEFDNCAKTAILWLHGGAFVIPASNDAHVPTLSRLCRDLDAVGFMPDYRLAPFNRHPAALDDCERAYRGLLDLGFDAERIVVCGDSAGGNLTLGLLQRIRRHGWPMPACAVPISPVTELGRAHFPPSRGFNAKRDPMIPIKAMYRVDEFYAGDWDASDPELSPLYADYRGFPPLFFLAGATEVLLDDSVMAVRQAVAAGVDARVDVWPVMPHAFPLFESLLPEAKIARHDIAAFIRRCLPEQAGGAVVSPGLRVVK
jgi:monoterpene epsilon-lactone hydrolase